MASIRAIYRNGQLQPLDRVELTDGQEVRIQILDEHSRTRAVLADILIHVEEPDLQDSFDEISLQREIDAAVKGVTLSDLIIEERKEGR
ncbi:MAG: antitoxin family protein [Anaerolineae bacterium]|nr:antitoxin family protein [Anaerolineae bacterium]